MKNSLVNFFNLLIISDVSILVIGRIIQIIISLVSLRLITTVLNVEEVGNYYLILSLGFFFSYIFLNPFAMYLSRHLVDWQDKNYVLIGYVFFAVFVCIVAFASLPITSFIYTILDYDQKFGLVNFITVVFGICLISCLHRNTLTIINILKSKKSFVFYSSITLAFALLCSMILTHTVTPTAIMWFYGLLLAEIVILPFLIQYLLKFYKLNLHEVFVEKSFKAHQVMNFCIPIFFTNIFLWSQLYLYRIIIDDHYGAANLAILGVTIAVASAIFTAVESLVSQYFYPIYLKEIHNKNKSERSNAWNKLASRVIPIYVLISLFIVAGSKNLLILLTDEKYHTAYVITGIAAGAELFRVLSNLYNYVLQTEFKTQYSILPFATGVAVNLTLLLTLDFSANIYGIAMVLCFANFVTFTVFHLKVRKIISINLDIKVIQMAIMTLPYLCYTIFPKTELDFIESIISILVLGSYLIFTIYLVQHRWRHF